MKIISAAAIIGTLALTANVAFAQVRTEISGPETKLFKSSELKLHKDAMALDDSRIRLTQAVQSQAGSAELPMICSKEYKVTFDLEAGNIPGDAGGAGFYIFRTRESRHEVDGTWGEYFPAKKTLDGRYNRLDLLHFDTWQDWLMINGQKVYQRDGNSMYYWTLEGGHQDVLGINAQMNQTMPFIMEGIGWFGVSMHFKRNKVYVQVTRPGISLPVLNLVADSYYEEKIPHYLTVSAWTGARTNAQHVRNITFQNIETDDCAPPLSEEQLKEELVKACGSYSADACPQECIKSTSTSLVEQGKLALDTYETAVRNCQTNVCLGDIDDSYKKGFDEGVASIDLPAIKKGAYDNGFTDGHDAGFEEGAASIDIIGLKDIAFKDGYNKGLIDGAASVDVDAIKKAAYQEGLHAGYEAGFSEGVASMKTQIDEAFLNGKASCEETSAIKEKNAYLKGLLTKKVTICHREPKKAPVTITVSTNALGAHLSRHGDTLGACPDGKK